VEVVVKTGEQETDGLIEVGETIWVKLVLRVVWMGV